MNSRLIRTSFFGALLGVPLGYAASYYAQIGFFRLGHSLVDYITQIHDILLCTGDFAGGDWDSLCLTAWLGMAIGPILCGVIAFRIGKKMAKQPNT